MIKEINVKDIKIIENSRTRTNESDVSSLMKDIKQNGLLHPIGVYQDDKKYILIFGSRRLSAYKKLGYKTITAQVIDKPSNDKLISMNTSENLHREDLKPHELGRVCILLQKQGLNNKEIASRLGLPLTKVEKVMSIIRRLPNDIINKIDNVKNSRNADGKLSVNIIHRILQIRCKESDRQKLIRFAIANALSTSDIDSFDILVRSGKTFNQAINSIKKCKQVNIKVPVNRTLSATSMKKLNMTFSEYVYGVLKGEIKPIPSIIM